MKTITLSIGELFGKLEEKYNVKFEDDQFVKIDDEIKIQDENGVWTPINGFIRKRDDLYRIKFDNGISKKLAGEHLISVEPFFEPNDCTTRFVKDFEIGDDLPYLNTKCTSIKKIAENVPVYGFSIDSEKHLYADTDGVIHHNTYTVTETLKKYIPLPPEIRPKTRPKTGCAELATRNMQGKLVHHGNAHRSWCAGRLY